MLFQPALAGRPSVRRRSAFGGQGFLDKLSGQGAAALLGSPDRYRSRIRRHLQRGCCPRRDRSRPCWWCRARWGQKPPQMEEQPVALAISMLFAEQLGEQLDVGGFAAAGAGAGELKQGLLELGTLDGVAGHVRLVARWQTLASAKSQVGAPRASICGMQGLHGQSALFRSWRGRLPRRSRSRVQSCGVHLHAELHSPSSSLPVAGTGHEGFGSAGQFLVIGQHGADGGVRADQGALAALDAVFGHPFGHVNGHTALFTARRCRVGMVPSGLHGGHGQLVAVLGQDGTK